MHEEHEERHRTILLLTSEQPHELELYITEGPHALRPLWLGPPPLLSPPHPPLCDALDARHIHERAAGIEAHPRDILLLLGVVPVPVHLTRGPGVPAVPP